MCQGQWWLASFPFNHRDISIVRSMAQQGETLTDTEPGEGCGHHIPSLALSAEFICIRHSFPYFEQALPPFSVLMDNPMF